MTIPALLFGILVSTFLGAGFHLWRGGSLGRLILYILLAWAGFWAGHWMAAGLEFRVLSVGPLHLGTAVVGSVVFLWVGYWLSMGVTEKKE
jgi:uncharacterized membrane protein YeaQ/YmgE (transglycosylase-associated protein family)